MNNLSIWSKRFSVARGWQWVREREVLAWQADEWLKVFAEDEPEITFKLAYSAPRG